MPFESMRRILVSHSAAPSRTRDLQIARIFDVSKTVLARIWGEDRAAYVSPVSFTEGTLKLETTSPAAKQQLGIDAIRLQNEINRQIGSLVVRKIVGKGKGF